MAFANVHTVKSLRETVDEKLALKLEEAKTDAEVEDILFHQIAELQDFLDREIKHHFRLVNLMTRKQLDAYDEIRSRLGPNASDEAWTQAISEWKEGK